MAKQCMALFGEGNERTAYGEMTMSNIQNKAYRQLTSWQTGFLLVAGCLITYILLGHWEWLSQYVDLNTPNLVLLGISILLVAVAYYGTIICHELYEINDQLAARSPELRDWIKNEMNAAFRIASHQDDNGCSNN